MTGTLPLFRLERDAPTSDDYYTPAWVFERMGIRFDLDVCAPPGGVPWIPADAYYTIADDGLAQPWTGRVWMNPPYSDVTPWMERFIRHSNGIALLPMAKSYWVNDVWASGAALVIGEAGGEMFFNREARRPLRIWFPVFFAAFGEECVEAISRLGVVRRAA